MKQVIIPTIAVLVLSTIAFTTESQSPFYTLQVTLQVNETNDVFIPGVGETTHASLPTATYTSPPDFYLATYINNRLKGLIFSQQNPVSIKVSKNTTHQFFTVDQNLSNSQVLIAFTTGDYVTIKNRMPLIKDASFLSEISPSFSFPLGTKSPLKLYLSYSDIDIRGNFIFLQGLHEVTLESNKTNGNKILIINETI